MATFFGGTDFILVKYALEGLPPLVLGPLRYVATVFLLLVTLRFFGRKGGPEIVCRDLPVLAGLEDGYASLLAVESCIASRHSGSKEPFNSPRVPRLYR